jgi:hypothetical protein
MARTIDWPTMRIAYTCGAAKTDGSRHFPTMAELSEEHGVSLSHIQHTAGSEKWSEDREDFKQRVYQSAVTLYEDEFSRLLAAADLDAAIAAADLIHHIRRQVERGTEAERTSLAKNISRPLRELIDIVHRAVGIEQALADNDSEVAA